MIDDHLHAIKWQFCLFSHLNFLNLKLWPPERASTPSLPLPHPHALNTKFCLASLTSPGCLTVKCQKRHGICQCSCGLILLNQSHAAHVKGKRNANASRAVTTVSQQPTHARVEKSKKLHTSHIQDQFTHFDMCDIDIPSFGLPLTGRVIPPARPPTWTETKWMAFPSEYKAPVGLINAVCGRDARKVVSRNFMPSILNDRTHGQHFQN